MSHPLCDNAHTSRKRIAMKHTHSVQDLLFDVDQVPVEAVVGSNGSTRRISIPGKKALVNKFTLMFRY